jgi:HlyD family secretion protein
MLLQQDFQMKIADTVSLIKKSTDLHRVSIERLEKYAHEDAPLQKNDLKTSVQEARQKTEDAYQNLATLKENLMNASMGDESARLKIEGQIETAKGTILSLENQDEKAAYNLRMFKQYTFPQKNRELERNVVTAEMALQKQLVNSTAQRVQLERKIGSQMRVLTSMRRKREDLIENIGMLEVTAPVDGVISFGSADPRRRSQQRKDITMGVSMNPSELIGTIPDLSQLVVNLDIPEVIRSKIKLGMRAEMRIKAMPNLRLSGSVDRISDLASHLMFWDRTSPKIYPTVISLDQGDEDLRPGMTVAVDIVAEEVKGVMFVPVEALYTKEGAILCRVKTAMGPEEREVKIGRSSSSFVEITSGLEPGERVLLSREEL